MGVEQFEKIGDEIFEFSKTGNIILAGDLNAHTGRLQEEEHQDEDTDALHFWSQYHTTLPVRYSKHSTTANKYGRALMELCRNQGMAILNGRLPSYPQGEYKEWGGYFIVNRDFFFENEMSLM